MGYREYKKKLKAFMLECDDMTHRAAVAYDEAEFLLKTYKHSETKEEKKEVLEDMRIFIKEDMYI